MTPLDGQIEPTDPTPAVTKPVLDPWGKAELSLPPTRAARVYDVSEGADDLSVEEVDEIADSPEMWGRIYGRVEHRLTKEIIPWIPTILQRRMIAHYRHCEKRNIPCRMVVVKIRRGGGSTGATGLVYFHLHNYRTRAGLVGTDYEVAQNLHRMLVTFDKEDRFPGWHKSSKVLETGKIEWPNGSFTQRYTAENPEASRSAGLQAYHASEVARWIDTINTSAKETLRSIRGSVPRKGFTLGIEESTANGASGAFFDTWTAGRWPEYCDWWGQWAQENPQNRIALGEELQFVRIFAAWFEDEESQTPCTADDEQLIARTLDHHEKDLIAKYQREGPKGPRLGTVVNATVWEQLKWRRTVIAMEFDGDREGFDQENPSSPDVAFRSSGRHTFNTSACLWMVETAKIRPKEHGYISRQSDGRPIFTRSDDSATWCVMWETPREGMRYLIGADTMTGEEQIKGSRIADYNAAVVIRAAYLDAEGRKHPPRVVAAVMPKNQDDPDVFADKVHLLSLFYGDCLVAFEVNNSGHAFKEHGKLKGMNMCRREKHDTHTQVVTEHLGWETNAKTRPQLIGTLQATVRQNSEEARRSEGIEVWSEVAAREFQAMVKGTDGVDRAPTGQHDDHVLAIGIGMQFHTAATTYLGWRRNKRRPSDGWRKASDS